MSNSTTQTTKLREAEDYVRAADQNSKILARLQEAGDRGVTNAEMWALGAHAAHSRISDLRKRGHEITCKREAAGRWRYTLVSKTTDQPSRFEQAHQRDLEREAPLFAGGLP